MIRGRRSDEKLPGCVILFVLLFIPGPGNAYADTDPHAEAGVLDLRNWDFDHQGPVSLSGMWNFYWNQFVDPSDLANAPATAQIKIPGTWVQARSPAAATKGIGFATHTLHVLLPASMKGREVGLRIGEVASALRLYLDGAVVFENGRVGRNAQEEIPGFRPGYIRFTPQGSTIDIVLQISNHFHFEGGPVRAFDLGLASQLEKSRNQAAILDYFVMGCAAIFSVYSAFLFFTRRSDKSHFLFSLVAFIILLRLATVNWHLTEIFPSLPDRIQLRIDYFTLFLAPMLYYASVRSLFPADFSARWGRASFAFAIFGFFCALLLPARIFTLLREPAEIVAVAVIGTAVLYLARAAMRKREGALFLAASTLILSLIVIYDIAHRLRFISGTTDLLPFGLIFVVCSHGAMLGKRLTSALGTSEQLSGELRDLNRDLEQRVTDRTSELEHLATTDPLTGIHNRRSLMQQAETECARARRHKHSLAVLMLDLDHFKSINDTHGHEAGDLVLSAFAEELLRTIREHDVVGRYGGEEFVLVLPHLDTSGGLAAAQRLQRRLSDFRIQIPSGAVLRITVSIGLAELNHDESFEKLLRRADEALYTAKSAGRNCIIAAPA